MISTWRKLETCGPDGRPTLSVPKTGYEEPWDDELDGSYLLRMMIRRRDEMLAELGEQDDTTDRIIQLLRLAEQSAKPITQAAMDRLYEIGIPLPEDWDDYDPRKEWEDLYD